MKNNTIVAYGICADNKDPWGVGRIRIIVDDSVVPPIRTALNITEYIDKVDVVNTNSYGDKAYIPWEGGVNGRTPDPYVIEPFLPKHINIIPKIGESVKIIYYSIDDPKGQREYIAPQISNYDKLNFDALETARGFSKRSTNQPPKNNLRINGLVPDPTDIALTGRKNSELVLPDNEIIARAGHQNFINKIKNNRNALSQLSFYPQRKKIVTDTVINDTTPTRFINYIVELATIVYDVAITPLYISTEVRIYPTVNVDTKNYSRYKDYFDDVELPELLVTIRSNKTGGIVSFIKDLLKKLDKNNMPLNITDSWVNRPASNPNLQYKLSDNRVSENTEVNFYPLNIYQVRQSPNNNLSINEVASVTNGITSELRPITKRPTRQLTQVKKDITVNDPNYNETISITAADKVFLLSWFNSLALQNRLGKYGFSQEDIHLTLQKNTQAMVNGDLLLNLLLDVLDLLANHGHSVGVDPIGSLNKDAVNKISEIKDKYNLNAPVTKNLTGGASILNQYLRLG